MSRRGPIVRWWFPLLAAALLASAPAAAGEFVINPLRVTLDRATRASEVLCATTSKVRGMQGNDLGQNTEGGPVPRPPTPLLYSPNDGDTFGIMVVRVGVRAAPVTREGISAVHQELPPAAAAG
jgi:hypothetical protein